MSAHDNDDITPEFQAAFAALPREREPGRLLEERTVRSLRERGLLQGPRRFRLPASWLAGATAAGVALFAAGLATGQWLGARNTERVVAQVQEQSARQSALLVQQTGSAYVNALSSFAAVSDTARGAQAAQGRAVAVQVLRAAAEEVIRIAPDDPVASGILAAYDRARQQQAAPGDTTGNRRVVWF